MHDQRFGLAKSFQTGADRAHVASAMRADVAGVEVQRLNGHCLDVHRATPCVSTRLFRRGLVGLQYSRLISTVSTCGCDVSKRLPHAVRSRLEVGLEVKLDSRSESEDNDARMLVCVAPPSHYRSKATALATVVIAFASIAIRRATPGEHRPERAAYCYPAPGTINSHCKRL
ncbi:MAG: hypothetical protein ACI85K_002758 [Hyphomicrobiaceae bacterium]